ncbi:MAG: serine hydrolase domain-containing protein [Bdellovibrionota bacterium]
MLKAAIRSLSLGVVLSSSFTLRALEITSYEQITQVARERGYSGEVLVKRAGHVVYRENFGFADADKKIPNTVSTRFAIGSATKQITAASILLLRERGLLKLDDTLEKLLPEEHFPWAAQVTVHQLLTHTSGIFNYTNSDDFFEFVNRKGAALRTDDLIDLFRNEPLNFTPGSQWSYCNSGFLLLGRIVEKLSGETYGDFIRKEFFEKLGMLHTSYEPFSWDSSNANPLDFDENYNLIAAKPSYLKWANSAGGVVSTLEDHSTWLSWLHQGHTILSDESLSLMKTPFVRMPVSGERYYGYGLVILDPNGPMSAIGHGGDLPSFHFLDLYYPSQDLQIIIATNQEPTSVRDTLANMAVNFSTQGKATIEDLRFDVTLSVEQTQKLEGSYEVQGFKATVFSKDSRLYLQLEGQGALWMIPQSETHFVLKDIASVDFSPGSFVLHQDAKDLVFNKNL